MYEMRLIENVKIIGDGSDNDHFRVDLPSVIMLGEIRPDANLDEPKARRVDVLIPDDEAEEIGNSGKYRLVKNKIKQKYRGNRLWDNDDPLDI